jgi:hypothetical protein
MPWPQKSGSTRGGNQHERSSKTVQDSGRVMGARTPVGPPWCA